MWSWSIQSACALDRERFALLCYEDDVAYDDPQRIQTIRLVRAHSITKTVDLRGEYVRICQVEDAKAEVAVLSSEGAIELIDFAGARIATEHIGTGGQPVNPYGHLTTIRQIAGHLYACGMGGQVHERMAPNDWRLISRDLCSENIYERWFSNIDGLSVSYLLAAGLAGALYFYDGRSWARMETSTEAPLGEMAFLDNRDVYAAGAQSTLLRGNPQSGFKKIDLSARDLTLYTICRYQNRIFLGTDRGIFELDVPSQALLPVDIGTHDGEIILLQATGDVMWAFGSKFIRRYNGAVWEIFDQIP